MKAYILGRVQHFPLIAEGGKQQTHHDIETLAELTFEEFTTLLQASQDLLRFEREVQLFKITLWNLQEYFDAVHALRVSHAHREEQYPRNRDPLLELNRCLINFLTSATTYLAYTEATLRRKHGKDTEPVRRFIKSTNKAYDDHYSYRLLYKLRNFAQHSGLPITVLRFLTEPGESPGEVQYGVLVAADRDALLETGHNFGAKVRRELEAGPKIIEIERHLGVFAKCLGEINAQLTKSEFASLRKQVAQIAEVLVRVGALNIEGEADDIALTELTLNGEGKTITGLNLHSVRIRLFKAAATGSLEDITSETEIEM
jgi:hypothetical protein